ncbi:MAG: glycosyltransferase family 2 protein [Planctomycetota bacterium]|jgi:dolichol-phosphate mannosyltransferase
MLPAFDLIHEGVKTGKVLVVLPVYNEMPALPETLATIRHCCRDDILVVDDHSVDGSFEVLKAGQGYSLIRNVENAGAGGVLLQGFRYALEREYDVVVTMDSDGQHNACQVHEFVYKLEQTGADMVWGTRYPAGFTRLAEPFQQRQEVNQEITERLRKLTGWPITDSFCGFRAYRSQVLSAFAMKDTGYGMLLEMTVRAWRAGFQVVEHPVPLIYLDETRDFQNLFQDSKNRLEYYHRVIDSTLVDLGVCPGA